MPTAVSTYRLRSVPCADSLMTALSVGDALFLSSSLARVSFSAIAYKKYELMIAQLFFIFNENFPQNYTRRRIKMQQYFNALARHSVTLIIENILLHDAGITFIS